MKMNLARLAVLMALAVPVHRAAAISITYVDLPYAPFALGVGKNAVLYYASFPDSQVGFRRPDGSLSAVAPTTPNAGPAGVTGGLDGNIWVTEATANKIGRYNPKTLAYDEFTITTTTSGPQGITTGPDGNVWFTEFAGNKIGKITPGGTITEYPGLFASSQPAAITLGPDGALWFTEFNGNRLGRITTSGNIDEYVLPTPGSGARGLTVGPDGNLWICAAAGNKVIRATATDPPVFTEFPMPQSPGGPFYITSGPDGALWFTESLASRIGRITTAGVITEYPVEASAGLQGIVSSPDGAIWFAESALDRLGRIVPGVPGDANGDGLVDVLDVFYVINFLFAAGPAPKFP